MNYAKSNPFSPPATSSQAAAAFAAESERIGFIRRTYLHLGLAILGFVAIQFVIFSVLPEDPRLQLVTHRSGVRDHHGLTD